MLRDEEATTARHAFSRQAIFKGPDVSHSLFRAGCLARRPSKESANVGSQIGSQGEKRVKRCNRLEPGTARAIDQPGRTRQLGWRVLESINCMPNARVASDTPPALRDGHLQIQSEKSV